ncbi:MAG: magnesium transporter [Cyclobacteriaceae bacterium]|nr:magnesium transporter [Cyclobacteriaceae bacterium]
MPEVMGFELTKEYLERFGQALDARDDSFVTQSLRGVKAADITTLLFEFSAEESKYVFGLLDPETDADILIELDEDIRKEFMGGFTAAELARYVDEMESDDAADVLRDLPLKKREEVIGMLTNEEKEGYILDLLRYDEDVAGGLMAKEYIKVDINWSVSQCIEEIRKQAEKVEKIYSLYVVDEQDRLMGRVSLKKIILSQNKMKIADIYDSDLISVETYAQEKEVADIMQKYDLESIPVVNTRGKLVGRITVDDVLDVITEMAEEERQIMSGISADVEEDDNVWRLSKARLPWLIIGMVGGLVAAQITDLFSGDIRVIAGLALFIPLIMATGGNVGIQSSSIVVQSLANKHAFSGSLANRLIKVLFVAIVNGVILSVMVFGAVMLIFKDQNMALTVSAALFCVVLLASFTGTITPIVLDRFGINPALASGPFITTANDLLGLAVYFSIAHLLYTL